MIEIMLFGILIGAVLILGLVSTNFDVLESVYEDDKNKNN